MVKLIFNANIGNVLKVYFSLTVIDVKVLIYLLDVLNIMRQ